MKTIKVYGSLAKFLGRKEFQFEVASAAEAVRALFANFPHLKDHMVRGYYQLIAGVDTIGEDELHNPMACDELKIVPVIVGAISFRKFFKSVGKILAGIALVAAVVFNPVLAGWLGPLATSIITGVGASLALGGVAEMLAPTPNLNTDGLAGRDGPNDPRKSYSFSGIQNTSRSGVPVPCIFGETIVGSVTISAGIDVTQT